MNITPNDQPRPWFDAITWILIYGGLLALVFSFVLLGSNDLVAAWLGTGGSLATAVGVLMIYIRSRKT